MTIWLAVAAAIALLWAWSALRPNPMGLLGRALATGDLEPVRASLERVSVGAQPTEYNRVIHRLWDGYHREEAVSLAKDFARRHRGAPVAQYWLHRFIQHEPVIAHAHLDDEFLAAYYDPNVASQCGSGGCGGCR